MGASRFPPGSSPARHGAGHRAWLSPGPAARTASGSGAPPGAPPLARPSLRRGRRPEQQAGSRRCPAWPAELPSKPLPPRLASARARLRPPGGPASRAAPAGRPPPAPRIRKRALQMLPRRDAGRLVPPPVLPVGASPGGRGVGQVAEGATRRASSPVALCPEPGSAGPSSRGCGRGVAGGPDAPP